MKGRQTYRHRIRKEIKARNTDTTNTHTNTQREVNKHLLFSLISGVCVRVCAGGDRGGRGARVGGGPCLT